MELLLESLGDGLAHTIFAFKRDTLAKKLLDPRPELSPLLVGYFWGWHFCVRDEERMERLTLMQFELDRWATDAQASIYTRKTPMPPASVSFTEMCTKLSLTDFVDRFGRQILSTGFVNKGFPYARAVANGRDVRLGSVQEMP